VNVPESYKSEQKVVSYKESGESREGKIETSVRPFAFLADLFVNIPRSELRTRFHKEPFFVTGNGAGAGAGAETGAVPDAGFRGGLGRCGFLKDAAD
jgi:hypothetical protein